MAKTPSPQPLSLAGRGANVPSLRFPEFTTSWIKVKLSEVCDMPISYGIVQTGENLADGVPCIRVVDLTNEDFTIDQAIRTSHEISNSYQKTILSRNDIMFALRGEIGLVKLVDESMIGANLTRGIARLAIKTEYYPSFLKSSLQSPKVRSDILKRVNGSALKEIPLNGLRLVQVQVPKQPAEQQKIADFLTAVDTKIQQLKRKHSLMQQYKKGVMQQLFSQQVRFKDDDGRDYPDWEEKRLGDVFTVTRGQVLAMTKVDAWHSDAKQYPVYSSQTKSNGLAGYFDEYLFQDAVTWTTDGANAGETRYRDGKFYCTNVCGVLLNNDGYANSCTAEMLNLVTRKYVSYVGNPKLMNNVMSTIRLNFPSVEEQRKIADFLGAIDAKIQQLDAQITQAETFKKGLLQQMFV